MARRAVIASRHRGSGALTQPSVVGSDGWDELVVSAQPATRSFACPAGTTKLVVFVCGEGYVYTGGGAVAFDGAAMTKAVTLDQTPGGQTMFVFRLDTPTTVTPKNLVFSGWNAGGSRSLVVFAVALANAAAGAFAATATSEAVGTTPINQVLSFTAATSLGLYCIARDGDQTASMGAAGAGQVQIIKRADGSRMSAHLSYKLASAAGNYTFSTTTDGASAATPRAAIEIAGV